MPGMDGFQVMEGLKEIEPDGYLPVLVITAQPGHKLRALQAGAKDFVSKPFELAEVLARVHNMLEVRLLHKKLHAYNDLLEQRVRERTAELTESYLETIFTMTRAAEHKDEDTGAHVQRISYYSRELAGRARPGRRVRRQDLLREPHARHRQDRHSRPHPPEAGSAHAGRVGRHEGAHDDGREDPRQQQVALPPDGRRDRARSPRALGRRGLPERQAGRGHPADGAHHEHLRRLRRPPEHAALQARLRPFRRPWTS